MPLGKKWQRHRVTSSRPLKPTAERILGKRREVDSAEARETVLVSYLGEAYRVLQWWVGEKECVGFDCIYYCLNWQVGRWHYNTHTRWYASGVEGWSSRREIHTSNIADTLKENFSARIEKSIKCSLYYEMERSKYRHLFCILKVVWFIKRVRWGNTLEKLSFCSI